MCTILCRNILNFVFVLYIADRYHFWWSDGIYKPHTNRYAAFAPIGAIATVFPFKWCWLFVHIAISS